MLLVKMKNDFGADERAFFQVNNVSANSTSAFTKNIIGFVGGVVSDIQGNRLTIGTHFLSLNKQKMRFVRIR
jgi:hypothetical protein